MSSYMHKFQAPGVTASKKLAFTARPGLTPETALDFLPGYAVLDGDEVKTEYGTSATVVESQPWDGFGVPTCDIVTDGTGTSSGYRIERTPMHKLAVVVSANLTESNRSDWAEKCTWPDALPVDRMTGAGSAGGSPTGMVSGWQSKCSGPHYRTAFEFKLDGLPVAVYLSAYSSLDSKPETDKIPTLGIYLDTGWKKAFPESTDRFSTYKNPIGWTDPPPIEWWPRLHVNWTDRGVLPTRDAKHLAGFILDRVRAGDIVEMGCHGAHGRTGTLLALLLIAAGYPSDAVTGHVRKNYCDSAIESKSQEDQIEDAGVWLAPAN